MFGLILISKTLVLNLKMYLGEERKIDFVECLCFRLNVTFKR